MFGRRTLGTTVGEKGFKNAKYDQTCRVSAKLGHWWKENAECKERIEGKMKLLQKELGMTE